MTKIKRWEQIASTDISERKYLGTSIGLNNKKGNYD